MNTHRSEQTFLLLFSYFFLKATNFSPFPGLSSSMKRQLSMTVLFYIYIYIYIYIHVSIKILHTLMRVDVKRCDFDESIRIEWSKCGRKITLFTCLCYNSMIFFYFLFRHVEKCQLYEFI